jgi:hypothetical protein
MAAREENVRRQWIMFASHFLDGCVHLAHSLAEYSEGICRRLGRTRSVERSLAQKVKQYRIVGGQGFR